MKGSSKYVGHHLGLGLALLACLSWLALPGSSSAWAALQAGTLANVSAASFSGTALASEAIVAAFGSRLATVTQSAVSTPLPTSLAGTTVKVKDSAGSERLAPLFFLSPGQVNYQIPAGTLTGPATVTVTSGDGAISTGTVQIAPVAPSLFSANSDGQGLAAAVALRIKADGTQNFEPLGLFDGGQSKFLPRVLDLGPETDRVYLLLFGTGIRNRSSLSAVMATIGGVAAEVLYAGPQGGLVGLDQLNLSLPRTLLGQSQVDIVLGVDGQPANVVGINLLAPDKVAVGLWGGMHIGLRVKDDGASIQYDCADGTIGQPLVTDDKGNFEVTGIHNKGHGGPVIIGEKPDSHPARYTGQVNGETMTLTVTLTDTKESFGPFTLTYGKQPRIFRCL